MNTSVSDAHGRVLLAWISGLGAACALAIPLQLAAVARLSGGRRESSFALGLLWVAIVGIALAATASIESGAVRWLIRAAIAAGAAFAVTRVRRELPRALEAVLALSVVALALALNARAVARIDANSIPVTTSAPPAREASEHPLVVIGLDGLEWDKLNAGIAAGTLPNFQRVVERSLRSHLETFEPTWSPIIWNTISTGQYAQRHHILHFAEQRFPGMRCGAQRLRSDSALTPEFGGLRRLFTLAYDAGLMQELPITGCNRKVPAFWDMVSAAGGSVAVVNWWASWPAYPVRGQLVSDNNPARAAYQNTEGHGNLEDIGITEPPELLDRLSKLQVALPSEAEMLAGDLFRDLTPEAKAKLVGVGEQMTVLPIIVRSDEFMFRATRDLIASERPQLAVMYATGVDNLSHRKVLGPTVIDRYYERVDALLGELLAATPQDARILIVSDHGWVYTDAGYGHAEAPPGVFMLSGPDITAGELGRLPHVRDVAPTVLALLGLPPSADMPGRAIEEALPAGVAARWSQRKPHAYASLDGAAIERAGSAELQDETIERLRALGYVE